MTEELYPCRFCGNKPFFSPKIHCSCLHSFELEKVYALYRIESGMFKEHDNIEHFWNIRNEHFNPFRKK